MAERKSKRKSTKTDETAEPTGVRKLLENPLVILAFVIVTVILLLFGIWGLAQFLSGA